MIKDALIIYDVIIAGSGPAGASAALLLAKNNYKVLVLEKEKLPRYKTCGGGLTLKGLNLINSDLSLIAEGSCYSAVINDFKADVSLFTCREKPMVMMTMRSKLDYHLIAEAKKFGAEILDCSEIIDVNLLSDGVEVLLKATNERFTGKVLIAADGAFSTAAKKYFNEKIKKYIPALEYEVYVDDETFLMYNNTARFDFGIAPHGYGWVFPKKDHLSIGILSMKAEKDNLNILFKNYLKVLGIKKIAKMDKHGFAIPMKPKAVFAKGRILLTGDAAGFADPVTGEGISFAILSGQIAAQSIIKGKLIPEKIVKEYNHQISQSILPELRAGRFLSFFIYKYPRLRILIFKLYGKKLSELITDVIMGEESYSELVKNPLNYLKLLFKWTAKNKKITGTQQSITHMQTIT